MTRFFPIIITIFAIGLFAIVLLQPKVAPAGRTGQMIDRQVLGLTDQGPVIVNVFASWCVPCASEMDLLKDIRQATGLPLIGIDYKDKSEAMDKFLKVYGNPYSHTQPDDGAAALALGITGVPETFLIDAQGKILWHYPGALSATQADELKQVAK